MIKNGPDELFAINSAGDIHFTPHDSVSPLSAHDTVEASAAGASSQKSRENSVGIVRR